MSENDPELGKPVGSSPTHIDDPKLAWEVRRAVVWVSVFGLAALSVYMARSLLVIFGGLVVAAMIDGGARALGRVLPIGRGWRVAIVIAAAVAFMIGLGLYAGATITREAGELPLIIEQQLAHALTWAQANGLQIDGKNVQAFASQLASGVGTVTRALSGFIGGITTFGPDRVSGHLLAHGAAPLRTGRGLDPARGPARGFLCHRSRRWAAHCGICWPGGCSAWWWKGSSPGSCCAFYGVPMARCWA